MKNAGRPVEFKGREIEVITLVCQGLFSREIGQELILSPGTVEAYQESIMVKMGINNKVGVVLYAIRHGLSNI